MACADQNVKHVEVANYMISNEDADSDEAWKWVDKYPNMSCTNPDITQFANRPIMLHAAAHYQACTGGEPAQNIRGNAHCTEKGSELWNWHKGHVPTQIMYCNQRLLIPPPDNFFNVQRDMRGRRRAFMICIMTKVTNDAVIAYKTKHCKPGFNTKKCIRPAMSRGRPEQNPDGFSLARVATEVPGCEIEKK